MIILWIRKNKADKLNSAEKIDGQSFHKHDDIMKRFRLAHPDIAVDHLQGILTAENPLQPMQAVKLWTNIQN